MSGGEMRAKAVRFRDASKRVCAFNGGYKGTKNSGIEWKCVIEMMMYVCSDDFGNKTGGGALFMSGVACDPVRVVSVVTEGRCMGAE